MKTRALLLVALLGITTARPARATTLVRLSLDQLVQASTVIARGHVLSQESLWTPDHRRIITLTTFAVAQALKGSPSATLVVQQLGGTVGNIRLHVSGNPRFHTDTDYLLFLENARVDASKYLVVGMMQGAYRIFRDQTTREERVISPVMSYLMGPAHGAPKPSELTMPLGAFRQQVVEAQARPIVIPRGTAIPVAIETTESEGVGRLRVRGRTTRDLFPSPAVVIPAGSDMEGTARVMSGLWSIHWTELSIRGARVEINATSEAPRTGTLRGSTLVMEVR